MSSLKTDVVGGYNDSERRDHPAAVGRLVEMNAVGGNLISRIHPRIWFSGEELVVICVKR